MSLPAINVDTDFSFNSFSLPSFSDVSARTPSRSSRRVSGRHSRLIDATSPGPSAVEDNDAPMASPEDARISSLDPRRLTPTLHATLVSEILNLRYEVQNKSKEMLGLEESLSASRDENARLNQLVADHAKDARTLKHHMKELEGGTMSALDEMATERDRAVEQAADLKKRLDTAQTKGKQHSDEANRMNALWADDQEKWTSERRNLEHKVTIAEGRLRAVLKEFEALQTVQQRKRGADMPDRANSRASRASGRRSAASMRRDSSASSDGGRLNRLSHISEIKRPEHGATLADELAFDDDEYDAEDDLIIEPISPEALPEEQAPRPRPFSAQSHRQSIKAFKLLGLAVEAGADVDEGVTPSRESLEDRKYGGSIPTAADSDSQSQYSDPLTQNSPPPTPKPMGVHTLDTITEASSLYTLEDGGKDRRVSDPVPPLPAGAAFLHIPVMVSSAVQTVEPPPSPPDTPKERAIANKMKKLVQMSSIAVQTEEPLVTETRRDHSSGLEVPVIAIHRPTSSQSDRSVVLPPHTKSISCQAAITVPLRSTGMQTEEIRIDQRPIKLPAHLLPSSISSKPNSPVPEKQRPALIDEPSSRSRARAPSPKKALKKILRESKEELTEQAPADGYVSDDSFIAREPVKKTLSRVRDSWQLISASLDDSEPEHPGTATIFTSKSSLANGNLKKNAATKGKEKKAGKALSVNTKVAKAENMRRTALVASGEAAHVQRARSPSLPTLPSTLAKTAEPPFPVPDRSSSRKFPWEGSDGTLSPTVQSVSFFGGDQEARRQRRPPVKRPALRKIRSETADPYRAARGRTSPPPTSASSFTELESPGINVPPLPNDDIHSPFRLPQKSHQRDNSTAAASAAESAATSDSIHVVDAIAQTMIGEWMWKYTRRRKSFGLGGGGDEFDARGRDGDSLRHQRWVWLAPCERAVLWSSKQPASSTALQGKLGHRKLEIQSVLDVRDDAPMPRGAEPASCFGRSILILTPQRALKFTAMSRERHYLWLSALSFLSQPGVVPAELGGVPPVPSLAEFTAPPPPSRGQIERNHNRQPQATMQALHSLQSHGPAVPVEAPKPATAFLRRHPVRDSIRVAKGKSRPTIGQGGRRAYTSPSNGSVPMPPAIPGRVSDAALVEQTEESDRGAEAPRVPRRAEHTRKRSNTGPHSATSFRSLGSSANSKTPSFATAVSGGSGGKPPGSCGRGAASRWLPSGIESEPASAVGPPADVPSAGYSSRYNSMGGRGSSSIASPQSPSASASVAGSFFEDSMILPQLGPGSVSGMDHAGTMRMDAFVRDTLIHGAGPAAAYRSGHSSSNATRAWKEPWSAGAVEGRMGGPRMRRDRDAALVDPFLGF